MSGRADLGADVDLLFVYGTLMKDYDLHHHLARRARFVERGKVRGRLLDLGSYPGMVTGVGQVKGEVYRLDDPELLPVLDAEEGYNFERSRVVATLASGRHAKVWVYRYRGPRKSAVPILDGDYRRARPTLRDVDARRPRGRERDLDERP
jgi:gamma-glutamylcyclotransferase (GGCT)/AIG2-like uncharacterized protein YtfP